MIFAYRVRKSPTKVLDGTIEADDESAALAQLRRLGYYPFELARQRGAAQGIQGLLQRPLGAKDLALFSRQMATLVGSGVGLGESLRLVGAQVTNVRFREALEDIRVRVEGGESLSGAMGNHRALFPTLLMSVVGAGETGGMLAEVLDRSASHYESLEELKGKVTGALVYPAFLMLVGVISIGVLVTFVVPGFARLFAGVGQELPLPTRILLAVSGFMSSYWWAVLGGCAALALFFHRAVRTGPGRAAWDALKLDMPLVGPLILKVETARFARTLSALLANGVPMLASLDVVANTLSNRRIAAEVVKVREDVHRGAGLSEALEKSTRFAGMALSLVRVGETSGATPAMLEKVAAVYEREVDRAAKALTTLLEPVLIIVMGGFVAFVVMSILLPVFNLNLVVQ